MKYTAERVLRIGIAFSFLYAGFSIISNPIAWSGFVPMWISNIFPGTGFLIGHGVIDIIIALWLLSGRAIYYAAIVAAFFLLSIAIVNLSVFDIVFRDVSIFFAAIALAILNKE